MKRRTDPVSGVGGSGNAKIQASKRATELGKATSAALRIIKMDAYCFTD
jgi:hypothetical protein